MGARKDDETGFDTPQHRVRLPAAFAVSRTEVTVEQFAAFVRDSGHKPAAGCHRVLDLLNGHVRPMAELSWQDPGYPQGRNHPVVCVSWNDAKAYVAWLAHKTGKPYRLLSEAEWEFAARAGTTTRYSFGDAESDICLNLNGGDHVLARVAGVLGLPENTFDLTCNDGHAMTAPVASFPANAFALHDMLGNVLEWVEDCDQTLERGIGYQGAPANGTAWLAGSCTGRITRGGHWASGPKELRVHARDGMKADGPVDSTGIRVGRTLQ